MSHQYLRQILYLIKEWLREIKILSDGHIRLYIEIYNTLVVILEL